MWRAYTGVIHCVFDQISNLQNCSTSQTKPRRRGGLRHLPPSPFTGQLLRKADIQGLVSIQNFGLLSPVPVMPELEISCSSKERDELDEEEDEKQVEMEPHCKKRLAIFPSPAGMSLTKLSLAGKSLTFFFAVRSPPCQSQTKRSWSENMN